MKRLLLTTLLLLPAFIATLSSAKAQCPAGENCAATAPAAAYAPPAYALQPGPMHPHFPPFGCGGYCIGFLSRIHFHGPLFNYGPYAGYYPFEPYGPWTSDLRYNAPVGGGCGWKGLGGSGLGWGHYAVSTLKNVFHRVNPLAHKCGGKGLSLGGCGSTVAGTASCSDGGCAVAAAPSAQPTQTSVRTRVTLPAVESSIKSLTVPGLLTGQQR